MRNRFLVSAGLFALAALLASNVAVAQTANPSSKAYSPARTPDGHPDLQGTYDLATITPMQRPTGSKLVLTKEEALKRETDQAARREKEDQPIDANRTAPPKGGDGSPGPYGNVGGYNYGWLDPGSKYNMVDGQYRTSLIIDPENGRMPPYTPEAQKRIAELRQAPTSDTTESNDPGLEKAPGAYDDPERRP